MFNRMTLFALAALAAITTAIVAPADASARGFGGGHGSHFGGGHFGGGHFGGRHFGGFRGQRFGRFGHWSRWSRWSRYRWNYRPYYGGYRPYYGGGGAGGTDTNPGPVATRRPTGGCLTKQYMDDGTVLFRDRCTGEEAWSNPDGDQGEGQGQDQGAPPAPGPRGRR